jgi:hypothetical protein
LWLIQFAATALLFLEVSYMALKQFSGQYLPDPDRILLKISTEQGEEYRFYITRRIAQLMLEHHQEKSLALVAQSTSPNVKNEVLAFKQDIVRQNTNWKQAFEPSKQLPLGEKPKLVIAVKYGFKEQANDKLVVMRLTFRDNSALTVNLTQSSLTALQLLIEQLQTQAQWGLLEAAITDALTDNKSITKALH